MGLLSLPTVKSEVLTSTKLRFKKFYSVLYVVMGGIDTSIFVDEQKSLLNALNVTCRKFKTFATEDWLSMRCEILSQILTRVDKQTNILDKRTKAIQSAKKVELPETVVNNDQGVEMDSEGVGSVASTEQTFISVSGMKMLNPRKKTVIGTVNKYVLPKWAKGTECD
ncbi:hypothetical protein EIN_119100 [Entamoeba invadens IP1]|uniref:Uncharacterized protein n=1 Tax=Entamoeba invadens IP1 TaxID=370355 RepID=L7FNS7_ENTIV|nr:hypothetical protein EIN_119100 [Entamoeba invadens IP1]ELP92276.1 hypothetical protein EIN_119100 [Entamoeba invadens IP1]|eukprot:XP_004259047.1 hypothetical protein EIN_119100 [Entamoeba invadens IP1]